MKKTEINENSVRIASDLAPEFVDSLRELFEGHIGFNRELGLKVSRLHSEGVAGHIAMRPALMGHVAHNRLHGGVISAGLDAMGGLAVMAAMGGRHRDEALAVTQQRFLRIGTIDLRIDYLRAAVGESFQLTAEVLRLGSRVASTRMEFLNSKGERLATGSAAYIVS